MTLSNQICQFYHIFSGLTNVTKGLLYQKAKEDWLGFIGTRFTVTTDYLGRVLAVMAQLSNTLKEWYGKALEELQTYQNKKGNNPNAFLIDFRNSDDALEFTKLVCIARGKPGQELVDLNKQKKEKKRVGSDDEEMKDESAEGKKEEEK